MKRWFEKGGPLLRDALSEEPPLDLSEPAALGNSRKSQRAGNLTNASLMQSVLVLFHPRLVLASKDWMARANFLRAVSEMLRIFTRLLYSASRLIFVSFLELAIPSWSC
jgi:hypothetical protein